MTTKRHVTYMLIASGALFVGLWAFGVSLSTALPYAFLLACPLMMVFMMRGMDHGDRGHGSIGHGGVGHEAPRETTAAGDHGLPSGTPLQPTEPASPDLRRIDEQYRR